MPRQRYADRVTLARLIRDWTTQTARKGTRPRPRDVDHARAGLVDRTLAGQTLYYTVQWLNEVGAAHASTEPHERRRSQGCGAVAAPRLASRW
jgi:hypothetical protein